MDRFVLPIWPERAICTLTPTWSPQRYGSVAGEAEGALALAHDVEGVSAVVDVAEGVGPARVAEEPEEVVVERAGHLEGHAQVLVLLLAQPRARVGEVDA